MPRDRTTFWALILMAASGALFALALPGCAPGVTGSYQTLGNIAKAGETSARTFESFDREHQLALVAEGKKAGKTKEQVEADLSEYQKKRGPVTLAFSVLAGLVQSGYALLPLVERGLKKDKDVAAWLSEVLAATGQLEEALARVGVKVPALPLKDSPTTPGGRT